jgi:hypothetical protein
VCSNDGFPGCPSGKELIYARCRAVKNGDRKAMIGHVENQVLAHDGEPDQSNICV